MSDDKEKSKEKLVVFPGGGAQDINAENLRVIKAGLTVLFEYQEIAAKMHRNKYLALLKQGFSEKEALELCKVLP